jgi:hypothetical protein
MRGKRRAKILRSTDTPANKWHWLNLDVERVLGTTDKALFVRLDGGKDIWLPRSQIHQSERFQTGDECINMTVTEWIYRRIA